MNRSPGAMRDIPCSTEVIQPPENSGKTLDKAFIVTALGGAVQALRPPKIGDENPRPRTVSRHFAPGGREKREKNPSVVTRFRGRLFSQRPKRDDRCNPFPVATETPTIGVYSRPYRCLYSDSD